MTYIKAYDEIRKLFADQPYAQHNGTGAVVTSRSTSRAAAARSARARASSRSRCSSWPTSNWYARPAAASVSRDEILEVKYRGKSIYDVLEMTVDDAIAFFGEDKKDPTCRRIVDTAARRCRTWGWVYIKLGQSSSTLSGGESAAREAGVVPDQGRRPGRRDVHLRRAHDGAAFPRHQQAAGGLQRR